MSVQGVLELILPWLDPLESFALRMVSKSFDQVINEMLSCSALRIRDVKSTCLTFFLGKHLRQLDLSRCQWQPGRKELKLNSLTNLTALDISRCPWFSDADLLSISQDVRGLKVIGIRGCRLLSSCGISRLFARCQRLESLDIGETNADDSCLHALSVSENKSTVVLLGLFGCCLITHMGVDYLQGLSRLTRIDFRNCPYVSGVALRRLLSSLSNLTSIQVSGDGIDAKALFYDGSSDLRSNKLKHITAPSILFLPLSKLPLSSPYPPPYPNLTYLDISCPIPIFAINDQVLSYILSTGSSFKPPSLETLLLVGVRVTRDCLTQAITRLPQLRVLDLTGCGGCTDETIEEAIIPLRNLYHLRMGSCGVTGMGVRALAENSLSREKMKYLDISGAQFMLEDDWILLSQSFPSLETLCVTRGGVTVRVVEAIAENLQTLRKMSLKDCPFSKEHILALGKMGNLEWLNLVGCQLPDTFSVGHSAVESHTYLVQEDTPLITGKGVIEIGLNDLWKFQASRSRKGKDKERERDTPTFFPSLRTLLMQRSSIVDLVLDCLFMHEKEGTHRPALSSINMSYSNMSMDYKKWLSTAVDSCPCITKWDVTGCRSLDQAAITKMRQAWPSASILA